MVPIRAHNGDGTGRLRRGLAKVTSLALGIAMFGTVGLSGALAQDEDVSVGIADAETIVNSIIAEVFAAVFGGDVTADAAADDAAVSGGGNISTGGSSGSTVTMGGGSDVSIGGGGSGGGVTVGNPYGG
jgi:hypothetical protein